MEPSTPMIKMGKIEGLNQDKIKKKPDSTMPIATPPKSPPKRYHHPNRLRLPRPARLTNHLRRHTQRQNHPHRLAPQLPQSRQTSRTGQSHLLRIRQQGTTHQTHRRCRQTGQQKIRRKKQKTAYRPNNWGQSKINYVSRV